MCKEKNFCYINPSFSAQYNFSGMANFHENFLQLVWKYQYFNKTQLATTQNLPLVVKKIGFHNFYEGPDFSEAHIRLAQLDHYGHVEIHLRSSDWHNHAHSADTRYDSVILHVVWDHDQDIYRSDGTVIPTLELKGKVYLDVLRNFERLISGNSDILCSDDLGRVEDIIKFSMLEKTLVERFVEKSKLVNEILATTKGDWEETTYRWLFYNFGFKANNAVMLKLATSLPYRILKRHTGQPLIQEALLMGQAGFLNAAVEDDYGRFLYREYDFFRNKYKIKSSVYPSEWKFMRVRPTNYPSVRLAQLAAILHHSPNLFSAILDSVKDHHAFRNQFSFQISSYWQHHYQLGKQTARKQNRALSAEMLDLLAINFMVPLWYAYGQYMDDTSWQERCFDLLQEISAEKNHITQRFEFRQWTAHSAYDSQGMIGLYNNYCTKKRCLECKVGQNLLRPQKV